MAEWDRRERVERHVEYVLEPGPYGAAVGDVYDTVAAAWRDYAGRRGLDPQSKPAGNDWCRVFAVDSEVVVRFTIEEPAR